MKKIVVALCALAAVAACNDNPNGFIVEGTIRGDLENGTKIFLKKTDEKNQPIDVDTTTVEEGKFLFQGESDIPELHYIFIDKIRGNIPFIVENGEIELKAQKDSLGLAKIKGTLQNDLFADFLKNSREISLKAMSMNEDMRRAASATPRDEATMASLREEYFELQEEAKSFELDYVKNNPNALISALIIDKVLTTNALSEDEVQQMYEALSPEIKATKVGKGIKEKLDKKKSTSVGSKAPNFSAPTPTGEELALHDVLGKVTIVDFWAAWCKPCRIENPNVVKVYHKYHEKGLNILSVSLDKKAEDWKQAILDDGLVWNHVSNVDYFDEIAQLYGVNAIPATFILDENGVIVAKNLRGNDLETQIASMLQ
ncbi:TlpA disulfide reductase family protein [Flavobacteriaceae bacterium 3-367]|uniref:redoxin domain-containing protein n=1 Tax=Eudoraea algarum TaxID=3417568 RepID=UPI00327D6061